MTRPVHHDCGCDHVHPHHKPVSERLFVLLEKVSAVALGAFAAYASFELFLTFFLTGTAVGIYQYITTGPREETGHGGSTCSQGFLEQLTGVKLPPLISLGANLAITWCHIDHHTSVFVPIIGLGIGAWAGQTGASLCSRATPLAHA